MSVMTMRCASGCFWMAIASLWGAGTAAAELVLSAYGGGSVTSATEVHYQRPPDTELDFSGVDWRSEPFTLPIYYGFRLGYWFHAEDRWGLAVDFTHDKLLAETERTVHVHGQRDGIPIDGDERIGDTFSTFAFSHGHNLVVGELIRSWRRDGGGGTGWRQRLAPYAGGGAGFTVPHVEVNGDGSTVDEYQLSGPVVAALAGLDVALGVRVRLFAEYKTSYAWLVGELPDTGEVEVRPWTHHLSIGLSLVLID